jgi:hypothetical protein
MRRLICHHDPGYHHGIDERAYKNMAGLAVEISRDQRPNLKNLD